MPLGCVPVSAGGLGQDCRQLMKEETELTRRHESSEEESREGCWEIGRSLCSPKTGRGCESLRGQGSALEGEKKINKKHGEDS